MQRVPTAREQPASGQAPAQLPPASGQSNQGSGADGAAQEPQQVSAPGRAETGGPSQAQPSQALAESQQSGGLASGAPQSSSGALKYMVMAGTGEKMLGKSRGRHEIICKSNQATLEI